MELKLSRYAGSRQVWAILVGMLVIAGCSRSGEDPEVEVQPQYANPIIAYAKAPPPRKMGQLANMLVRELDSSGQSAFLVPLFLSPFGFPNFEGVSGDLPITAFFFSPQEGSTKIDMVVLIHASRDSSLIRSIRSRKEFALRETGNYLILGEDEHAFARIKDTDELIRLAEPMPRRDFEFTLLPGGVTGTKPDLMRRLQEQTEVTGFPEMWRPWMLALAEAGFGELESTRSMSLGLDISRESLSFGFNLDALRGSPLGQFLNQETEGRNQGGRYIPASHNGAWVGDYDPKAYAEYGGHIFERLAGLVPEELSAKLLVARRFYQSFFELSAGLLGLSQEFGVPDGLFVQYLEGSYTDAWLTEFYQYVVEDLAFPFLQSLGDEDERPFSIFFEPDAGSISGVPYHRLGYQIQSESKDYEVLMAVVSGSMVSSNHYPLLEQVVQAVESGKPIPENIATHMSEPSGLQFQGYLDLPGLLYTSLTARGTEDAEGSPFVSAMKELSTQPLAPATMEVSLSQYRLDGTFAIPLSTVKVISAEIGQAMMQRRRP